MAEKKTEYADAPEGFWQIITGLEAEGLKYLGSVSRKTTPDEHQQVDVWEESARKRNAMITEVHYGEIVFVFERADAFPGPRTKRTAVRSAA